MSFHPESYVEQRPLLPLLNDSRNLTRCQVPSVPPTGNLNFAQDLMPVTPSESSSSQTHGPLSKSLLDANVQNRMSSLCTVSVYDEN